MLILVSRLALYIRYQASISFSNSSLLQLLYFAVVVPFDLLRFKFAFFVELLQALFLLLI